MTTSSCPGLKLVSITCIEVLRCRGTAGWLWPRHHSLAWWTLETMSALRCVKCLVLWFTFFGLSFGSAQVSNKCQCRSTFRFNSTFPRNIFLHYLFCYCDSFQTTIEITKSIVYCCIHGSYTHGGYSPFLLPCHGFRKLHKVITKSI